MNRDILKNLIELVPDKDIDTLYKVIIKFVPKDIIASDSETLDGLLDGSDEKNKCVKITLPCKVGSNVYAIIERKLRQCRVEGYTIDSGKTSTVYLSYLQTINGKEEKNTIIYIFLNLAKHGSQTMTKHYMLFIYQRVGDKHEEKFR